MKKITECRIMNECQASQILKQILSAVDYCHRLNVIHRDLKPENIVFVSKKHSNGLRIIDFGRSTILEPTQKITERAGTVNIIILFLI